MAYTSVLERLRSEAEKEGLEVHPFKIGWYNTRVQKPFHFPHHEDTFAVLVISTPSMFEKLVKPYLFSQHQHGDRMDPLDSCLKDWFTRIKDIFPEHDVEVLQDFELHVTRRPKVLVQTAGHVSGAAYYYQREDVSPEPWDERQRLFGVSVHPKYGGWFALRGVMIFKDLLASGLVQQQPVDCVSSREGRIELLEKFNFHWRDWSYRDVTDCTIVERYSEDQRTYFATEPCKRFELIKRWLHEGT